MSGANLYIETTITVRRTETKTATLTGARLREILGVPREARIMIPRGYEGDIECECDIEIEWSKTEEFDE